MDTSETYIKMVALATEIQALCPEIDFAEWLPRQDQLQKMVIKGSLFNLLINFVRFLQLKKQPSYPAQFTSMEQLWLAFVMKENGKVWSGEGWVKEG